MLFLGGAVSALAFFREASVRPRPPPPAPLSQDQSSEVEAYFGRGRAPRAADHSHRGRKSPRREFNDFQCPACGQSYLQYKPIFAKYEASRPGEVRLVLKDYPLNPNCNSGVRAMVHSGACDAAVAVRLAQGRNRDALEDWLYTHQPEMTPASVRQAARDVGMVTDFDAKYAATLELVKGDIALGKQLHVTQTPTFFVNGVKIEGMWTPQYFDQAIAYELRRAGSGKP